MLQNILILTLFVVATWAAPSVSRLETIDAERTSLNTIEAELNDRSMEMLSSEDDLTPVVAPSQLSSSSLSLSSLPSSKTTASTTEASTMTPQLREVNRRFNEIMKQLSGGQSRPQHYPLMIPLVTFNNDMIHKRIIFTAPTLADTNPDMKPE